MLEQQALVDTVQMAQAAWLPLSASAERRSEFGM